MWERDAYEYVTGLRCRYCRDGSRAQKNPNGYLWHWFSGDSWEPCELQSVGGGTGSASQEGPSEGERIITEWVSGAWPSTPKFFTPRDGQHLARLIDSALSSKGVAVRDEALEKLEPVCCDACWPKVEAALR